MSTSQEDDILLLSREFTDYQPIQITDSLINQWLQQYNKEDHPLLIKLLKKIKYYSEQQVEAFLKEKNQELLKRLKTDGIPIKKVIYITIDETATSSHEMLIKLKRVGRLERSGCKFIDSKNIYDLNKIVHSLGNGAIIYIDDFAGTGNQLCRSRDHIARNIQVISTNFSEFFLAPCICEEALIELKKRGVVAVTDHVHTSSERVLHPNNSDKYFSKLEKKHLIELCCHISKKEPLGYKNLATMVAFYRNSPNTTPLILRGNIGQNKYCGIIPRTTDLPAT